MLYDTIQKHLNIYELYYIFRIVLGLGNIYFVSRCWYTFQFHSHCAINVEVYPVSCKYVLVKSTWR